MRKMMGDIMSPWKTPQVIGKTEVTQEDEWIEPVRLSQGLVIYLMILSGTFMWNMKSFIKEWEIDPNAFLRSMKVMVRDKSFFGA